MNKQLELLTKLKSKMIQISNEINTEENLKINELEGILNDLLNKVNNVKKLIENNEKVPRELRLKLDDFENLDDEIIKKLFPNYNVDSLKEIKALNWKSPFFNRNKPEILNKVSHFCTTLLEKIKIIKQKTDILIKEKEKVAGLCDSLQNEYTHIFSNGNITTIIEMLRNEGKTEDEILDYLKEMFFEIEVIILNEEKSKLENLSFDNKNDKNPEDLSEEILEENEETEEFVKNKIIEFLTKNGYQNLIKYFEDKQSPKIEKAKKDLFRYGSMSNIEEIISVLSKYNINLTKEIENNGNFYKILVLFLYSTRENIETIFKLALEPEICICNYDKDGQLIYNENGSPQINFTSLLEKVSRFIKRKKRYRRRGSDSQNIEIDNNIEGNLGDYIKNIRFFQNLGVDIKELFKKYEVGKKEKGAYFDNPHEKVKRNKEIFDFYGIPMNVYLARLNCFTASNPADAIDKFIELDLFDYAKLKVSRLALLPDNPIFYRIVRTYQLAATLPNPNNLSLHQNAKQFLFKKWNGNSNGNYEYGVLEGYISNPDYCKSKGIPLKLDTEINDQNGWIITNEYRRAEVLSTKQKENFERFDNVIKNCNINYTTFNYIKEESQIMSIINRLYHSNDGKVLIFGKEPVEVRISKNKFLRIYNALIQYDFYLENDSDCILYALTYNSILTNEQFLVIKTIVDNVICREETIERAGGRK